jgi:hypothetical protein
MSSYSHRDILAITKLIPNINLDALTNDKLEYWYNQLNTQQKTITEFINTFTPYKNYIDISSFLTSDNKDDYVNETLYTINAIISDNDNLKLSDPSNNNYSLRYKNITLSDNNDLLQILGTIKKDNLGYYININEATTLMADWKNFDF